MNPADRGPNGPEAELALLEHVARTIGDFVLVMGVDGNLTYVNEAVLERSGWTREELLGRPWRLFLAPSNPPGIDERIVSETRAVEPIPQALVVAGRAGQVSFASDLASLDLLAMLLLE